MRVKDSVKYLRHVELYACDGLSPVRHVGCRVQDVQLTGEARADWRNPCWLGLRSLEPDG